MIYPRLRSLLFRLPPERAHALSIRLVQALGVIPGATGWLAGRLGVPEERPVELLGLRFPNRLGLAAGYDKDGLAWRGLAGLGFGHVEVGTVTLEAQPGNPRPRLFRLTEEGSLINRMGFPGAGADVVARRLRRRGSSGPVLGVNLGKNTATPLEEAEGDYRRLIRIFAPLADYLAVNVSCPNTGDLPRLQARDRLEELLGPLDQERRSQVEALGRRVPLLVKLSPDLEDRELDGTLEAIQVTGMDGVIATNTTLARPDRPGPLLGETGGLSGTLLREQSLRMVRAIRSRASGDLPIIGLGGIASPEDALALREAGADLVQLYTGLVYQGPGLPARVMAALLDQ